MENKQEIVIEEKKSWNEINKQFCERLNLPSSTIGVIAFAPTVVVKITSLRS